ncbi:sterol carrier protein domain-containing protein [Zopfochytrium polystomum]|nr:sterol carrier protein domain-containing protein [Zopfochytrium polystomum]
MSHLNSNGGGVKGRHFRKAISEADFLAIAACVSLAFPAQRGIGPLPSFPTPANQLPRSSLLRALQAHIKNGHVETAKSFRTRSSWDPTFTFWGVFEDEPAPSKKKKPVPPTPVPSSEPGEPANDVVPTPGLLGSFGHIDYKVTLFGREVPAGGLTLVTADILHKKQGVGKDIVLKFLSECDAKVGAIVLTGCMWPIFTGRWALERRRPSQQIIVHPSQFPAALDPRHAKNGAATAVEQLYVSDAEEVHACLARYQSQTHGCLHRSLALVEKTFWRDAGETRWIGWRDADGELRGFLSYKTTASTEGPLLIHDMEIGAFVYETVEALSALCRFLHVNNDQMRYVKMLTQEQELFRIMQDTRNAAAPNTMPMAPGGPLGRAWGTMTLGMMYRVVNVEKLFSAAFADRDFNGVDGLRLVVKLKDTFTPERNPPVLVSFSQGKPKVTATGAAAEAAFESGEADAVLKADVSQFSAVVVGAATVRRLVQLGVVSVSPADKLSIVNRAFWSEDLPSNPVFF